MKTCVIGTGYVGLVTGAVLAEVGHDVTCVDKDAEKIATLQAGRPPFHEPGLVTVIRRESEAGRLRFTTVLPEAVGEAQVVLVAVGTPSRQDGSADLSAVDEVGRALGGALGDYTVVATKSTVPVGTGLWLRELIRSHAREDVAFDVAANPEFLREGSAVADARRPDRIVIGADRARAVCVLRELYAPFACPVVATDLASAEMIKCAANAFLATKISFANAMADVCELTGASVLEVTAGIGIDPRIGPAFLDAGLGFGGACFPKDTKALVHVAASFGYDLDLLRAVLRINAGRAEHFVEKMRKALGPLDGACIGLLGLAFKPNTDDMREAKSVEVARLLDAAGAELRAYDPVATERARRLLPASVRYCASPYEAAAGADALALVTEWDEFRDLDLDRIRATMARPLVFDGRNVFDPERMGRSGFEYHSIGRAPALP
jgi:UDPglucose 6-dehydrogenase